MNGTSVLHAKRKTLVCAFLAMSENYKKLMVSLRGTKMLLYYMPSMHIMSQHALSLDSHLQFPLSFCMYCYD